MLLDEIGEMPLLMQAKLLRALEEQRLRPVGSDEEVSFNVRILSATNRDLEAAIEEERFREDLYFRVNVIQIDVPPLCAAATYCCSPNTSYNDSPSSPIDRCRAFPPTPPQNCWLTVGREMSESCAT